MSRHPVANPGRVLIMLGAGVLVAGCASQTPRTTALPARHPGTHVDDGMYIAAVEQKARRRGLQVQWIHPPLRRVSPSESARTDP